MKKIIPIINSTVFWIWILSGVFLVIAGRDSYGSDCAIFVYAAIFLIYAIWKLIRAIIRREKWVMPVAVILYSFLLVHVSNANIDSIYKAHEDNFRPLITALEIYKEDQGQYPDQLEKLVPKYIDSLPACHYDKYLHTQTKYYGLMTTGDKPGDQYMINCMIGIFVFPQYATYESDDPTWFYSD